MAKGDRGSINSMQPQSGNYNLPPAIATNSSGQMYNPGNQGQPNMNMYQSQNQQGNISDIIRMMIGNNRGTFANGLGNFQQQFQQQVPGGGITGGMDKNGGFQFNPNNALPNSGISGGGNFGNGMGFMYHPGMQMQSGVNY